VSLLLPARQVWQGRCIYEFVSSAILWRRPEFFKWFAAYLKTKISVESLQCAIERGNIIFTSLTIGIWAD
jgi:hypothetical protein